jgi:hypothetical protein
MSGRFLELEPLFSDIAASLANNPDKLAKFTSLADSLKAQTDSPVFIYASLASVLSDDPRLLSSLQSVSVYFEPADRPMELISQLINSLAGDTSMTRVVSIFVKGWMSLDLVKKCLSRFVARMPPEVEQILSQLEKFVHTDTRTFRTDSSFPPLKVDNSVKLAAQMLILIGLKSDHADNKSALKCLKLFALRLVSIDTTALWLRAVDDLLSETFELMVDQIEPSIFIPSQLFDRLVTSAPEHEVEWILGPDLFKLLKQYPKIHAKTMLEYANQQAAEARRMIDRKETKAAASIAELQSVKFFMTLRSAVRAIRNDQQLVTALPEGVIAAVFGPTCQWDKTHQFYHAFFEKVQQLGKRATQTQTQLLDKMLGGIELSSPEARPLPSIRPECGLP